MNKSFLGAMCGFFENLGLDGIFFLAVGLITAVFITLFILHCVRRGKTKKERFIFILFTAGMIIFQMAGNLAAGSVYAWELLVFPLITLSFASLLFIFFVLFGEREFRIRKEHKDLIRIIDKKIKDSDGGEVASRLKAAEDFIKGNSENSYIEEKENEQPENYKITCEKSLEKNNSAVKPPELDFTHVKNVIERLNYYNLNSAEKRQVKDLKYAVSRAESGNALPETQSQINDGLGAVLKIMAKYGV